MFFKKKTLLSMLLIVILLMTLSTSVMARDNFAFSAGTTFGGINTIQDINDASYAYSNAGYRTYSMADTSQTTYMDFQLKIGEFVTTAGFTVEIQNDNIKAIYDNNIDIDKQEKALSNVKQFALDLDQTQITQMRINAIREIESKNENITVKDGIEMKYYYDIEEDKKYVVYSIPNVMNTENGEEGIAYDTVECEI